MLYLPVLNCGVCQYNLHGQHLGYKWEYLRVVDSFGLIMSTRKLFVPYKVQFHHQCHASLWGLLCGVMVQPSGKSSMTHVLRFSSWQISWSSAICHSFMWELLNVSSSNFGSVPRAPMGVKLGSKSASQSSLSYGTVMLVSTIFASSRGNSVAICLYASGGSSGHVGHSWALARDLPLAVAQVMVP